MKIYLDLCAIQRPLDTPNQIRITLEAEAVLGIIAFCVEGQADLLSSEALSFESDKSPLEIRREHTQSVLSLAKLEIRVTDKDMLRASRLMKSGIKALDALHLALAESGQADFFCTCDDGILQKAKKVSDLKVIVINPVDLVREIEV